MGKKKKTRQEKIIADLKRRVATQEPKTIHYQSIPKKEKLPQTANFITSKPRVKKLLTRENAERQAIQQNTSFIKKDLTKTFVLAILAISLELVIHFLTG